MKKPRTRKKTESYHHGDLRSALITAALRVLKTRTPSELSLRELAKQAGVSQAAPYRHFKDKEALIAAILEQAFTIKREYMERAMNDAQGDAHKIFIGCGLAYFRFGLDYPQHFNLMFSDHCRPDGNYPDLLRAAVSNYETVVKMVKISQDAGIIGAGDPFHHALHCWALVNGFTVLYTHGKLLWLGIDQDNAEKALIGLIEQYRKGSSAPLDPKAMGFELFNTDESRFFFFFFKNGTGQG